MIHSFDKLRVKLKGSYFNPIPFELMLQYSFLVIFFIIWLGIFRHLPAVYALPVY